MSDIVIPAFTIPGGLLFPAFLAAFLVLVAVMIISTHREKLRKFIFRKESAFYPILTTGIILFVIALFRIVQIILDPSTVFKNDPRGYAVILAALIGAPFVIWRTWVAQRQADTDEQGLITDRITKAVGQLGAEKTVWEDNKQTSKPANLIWKYASVQSMRWSGSRRIVSGTTLLLWKFFVLMFGKTVKQRLQNHTQTMQSDIR